MSKAARLKQGDLLFEIDPRPFQAALDQALGKLAQDQAQRGKTELDVKRYTPLAKEQAISQEQLDDAVQANLAAKAAIKADEAAVESAQLNLGFCKITSPVDGIAGHRPGANRRPGRPSGARADDGFHRRSDAGLFQYQRAILSGLLITNSPMRRKGRRTEARCNCN